MPEPNPTNDPELRNWFATGLRAFLSVAVACITAAAARPAAAQVRPDIHVRDFLLQSSVIATDSAATISSVTFEPRGWYPVKAPTTVLRGLVENGVYPDPYVGMNNLRIPDASDAFNQQYDLASFSHLPGKINPWTSPWWYRAELRVPPLPRGTQVWLNLDGINYRADVWLNGKRVADARDVVGMFRSFTLRVTDAVHAGRNILAVRVHPLDTPGLPGEPQLKVFGTFGLNGGATGDIGKNVTMQASVGWDWIPEVHDRNMGIWQDVRLRFTGPVDVRFPHVVTDLPLPDTTSARLSVSAELHNASLKAVSGILQVDVRRRGDVVARVQRRVTVPVGRDTLVTFTPAGDAQLIVKHPALWWPVGHGGAALYDLDVRFVAGGRLSDRESVVFGMREVGTGVTEIDGWLRRDFYVNGRRVRLLGGAWVPDMMLVWDRQHDRDELRLWRGAGFNTVRIWGGGVTPPESFFATADSLGLMVWHDFWITGDCQGTWDKGTRDWPLEGNVFIANALDTAKRLRNHPSLLVWTGGNEGYPRRELYDALRNQIAAHVDGTRPFLPSSGYAVPDTSWGLSWPDNHDSGAYSGGPYQWVEPAEYYRLVARGRDWLFKDEVGIPSLPPLASLKRFIADLDTMSSKLTNTWGYHDAAEGNGKFSVYDRAIRDRYGEPATMRDYTAQAQLLNAESYRAIFEAANQDPARTAGVLLWKTNSAWPSVMWQVYDWYLRPNAGYYFAKVANRPLHAQLHPITHVVSVVNATAAPASGLMLHVELYDASLRRIGGAVRGVRVAPGSSHELLRLSEIGAWDTTAMRLVRLELRNASGETVDDNTYWVAPHDDFRQLRDVAAVSLEASARQASDVDQVRITLTLKNANDRLAFSVHPVLTSGQNGDEVLPTFWSDNYFSVAPGATRTVVATVDRFRLRGRTPYIRVEGWNVKPTKVRPVLPTRR